MTKPRDILRGTQTFGWDHRSPYSSNRGDSFSNAAFGHGVFTGTVMWIDPEKELVFIFLASRLHPDRKSSVNKLAYVKGSVDYFQGRISLAFVLKSCNGHSN